MAEHTDASTDFAIDDDANAMMDPAAIQGATLLFDAAGHSLISLGAECIGFSTEDDKWHKATLTHVFEPRAASTTSDGPTKFEDMYNRDVPVLCEVCVRVTDVLYARAA